MIICWVRHNRALVTSFELKIMVLSRATFLVSNGKNHVTCNFMHLAVNDVKRWQLVTGKGARNNNTSFKLKNLVTKLLLHLAQQIIIAPDSPGLVDFPVGLDIVHQQMVILWSFLGKFWGNSNCYCCEVTLKVNLSKAGENDFQTTHNTYNTSQKNNLLYTLKNGQNSRMIEKAILHFDDLVVSCIFIKENQTHRMNWQTAWQMIGNCIKSNFKRWS